MTQEQHPVTPPDELVEKWTQTDEDERFEHFYKRICTQSARWGADQELEACCEWLELHYPHVYTTRLKRCRRPQPPSLKEQAMQAMDRVDVIWATDEFGKETLDDINVIRRALESLPD